MQKIKKIYHIFIEYPLDRHREKTTQVVSQNDNEDDLERQYRQLAKHPKNQQIFRGPRWQSYGGADRSNEVR
jgi:hypothetical protein